MVSGIEASGEDVAARRILRLALGVTLALVFSQTFNWPMAYVTGILTLILLGMPTPALNLKQGVGFVLVLIVPLCISSLIFMPLFEFARWSGVLLFILALFYCFYVSARGESMVLGLFMTMSLALVAAIGSVSIDALLTVISSMGLSAAASMLFVWIAHAFLPELPVESKERPKAIPPTLSQARHQALRSLVIILPITIFMLFSGSSATLLPLMLKVVAMGQQANTSMSRQVGIEQIQSTLWGGFAAIIAWQIMSIWPSLIMYGLIMAISSLFFASRMFQGYGMHAKTEMWSYAFLTMIIILTPALADSQSSNGAHAAFYTRLILFAVIGLYGWLSVVIFDEFFPVKEEKHQLN